MIKFEDVSFRYEGSNGFAVKGISLDFGVGRIYGVIGPNGSGKSTLLRMMNGLIPHFYRGEMAGRVLVDGVDTREASVAQLARKVGLVFQNPEHMFFSESVEEEVSFGPRSVGMDEDEIRDSVRWSLEEVGLWELRGRSPWSLSGGEMKRLSIACVLSMRPTFVALDEPTVGQDAISKDSLISLLRRLRDEGKGIIVVTHDIEWLEELDPDEVLVLNRGSIYGMGSPEDIFSDIRGLVMNQLMPPASYLIENLLRRCLSVRSAGDA
ncbi:energy-coupling factor ABC transporter ATP-binding protein [Candidatus Korarchaeum cryptofilum]|uniref:ABC-type cobalt transport system, ATPase component n=1 Tax=Korarchaeum cryptofilum (strain OPF8) TaxID=374847 RepID=B1L6P9_KORCO|nr:ABC transporter ATP-binding protein [Candidatus Korarchaeum cryptofilum]ACB08128.1 ABC-type cobalt transport system, ATPase component [Candidatus Korarchaeum cryptofilum OPF8]